MATGILIVDKPRDWTSHDVVAKLRGVYGQRRVGHTGTLDPLATGVLVVLLGRATRASELTERADKTYLAGLRLGVVTDTQDVTGTVLETHPVHADWAAVATALDAFLGEQEQLPPMYSAVKVQGKKLYELARRGQSVARTPRRVVFHELELLPGDGPEFLLRVRCSKGTYVRTLCHDLGAALGCGGCLSSLRRIAAGGFSIDQAVTMDEILAAQAAGTQEALLLPVDSLFSDAQALTLDASGEARCRNGAALTKRGLADGLYRVYGPGGDFLMLGQAERGQLRTVKSFFEVT